MEKTKNNVGKDVEKLSTLIYSCWEHKWSAAMEKNLAIPQKVKHRITMSSSNSTPRYKAKRTENKFLYINVHSSTIHNSQKVGTIQTSISR